MRLALQLALLATAWLLWSGVYQPLSLTLGLLSCLLALYLALRMGFFERGVFSLHLLPRLPRFWSWLLLEIVKANLNVAAVVLRPWRPLNPVIIEIHTTLDPIGKTLLANSITLTPGTVTLDVCDGKLRVHCLTRATADSLLSGEMGRRVSALTER